MIIQCDSVVRPQERSQERREEPAATFGWEVFRQEFRRTAQSRKQPALVGPSFAFFPAVCAENVAGFLSVQQESGAYHKSPDSSATTFCRIHEFLSESPGSVNIPEILPPMPRGS